MAAYFFTPPALKQIKKLSPKDQKRIIKKLDFFCQKNPLQFADSLTDFRLGGFRFRIGDYRVIFDKEPDGSILILAIGHRKEIYKR